jgi:mono/diheme cytochrome c family protein
MSHESAPHGPATHGPGSHDPIDDPISSQLAVAQFLVTTVVIGCVAALAYVAGLRSGGGGHGGQKPEAAAAHVDVSALMTSTPELIAKGKNLFGVNCASCHGTSGHGDGPAAAALNPKPRNFTESYWRYGGGLARVVRTITEGSPGTAMSAFPGIPIEDRIAIAHFVRSLGPKLLDDKPEDLAWLNPAPAAGGAAAGAAVAGGAAAPTGPVIPIADAMKALAVAEPAAGVALAAVTGEPGADVYAARCASCHGVSGEGGIRTRMLGSAPYAYVTTRSLGQPRGDWASNGAGFEKLVLEGLPGFVMPANGDLSRAEIRDLYNYTQQLRARQEAGARSGS